MATSKKLPFLLGDTIDTSSFMFFFFSQSCYPRVALCIGFFFKADQWGSTLPDTASLHLNIGRGGSLFRSRRSYMKCLEEVAALVVAQDVNTFWGGIWTPNISWEGFQGFQTPPYQVCQGQKSLKMGMVIQPPNRNPFFMGIQTPTMRLMTIPTIGTQVLDEIFVKTVLFDNISQAKVALGHQQLKTIHQVRRYVFHGWCDNPAGLFYFLVENYGDTTTTPWVVPLASDSHHLEFLDSFWRVPAGIPVGIPYHNTPPNLVIHQVLWLSLDFQGVKILVFWFLFVIFLLG